METGTFVKQLVVVHTFSAALSCRRAATRSLCGVY